MHSKELIGKRDGATGVLISFIGYLKPYWTYVAGTYTLMVAITGLSVTIPQFIRWIVDRGIRQQDLSLLALAAVALLTLGALRALFTHFEGRWSEVASQGVAFDIRNDLHAKLASLSFSYHDSADTGELLSRSIQDVERIRFLTGRAFLRVTAGLFLFVATAVILIRMNLRLAALSLALLPVLGCQSAVYGGVMRRISLRIQEQLAVLTSRVEQNLSGVRIVKSFAQERSEIERFERENGLWFSLSARAARIESLNLPLMELLANLGTVIVIFFGGLETIRGRITLGEFVAFTTYLTQLIPPIRRVGHVIPAISQAVASGRRIREILDAQPEVQEHPRAVDLQDVKGEVRFEDVSFSYFGRHTVLDRVSFRAAAGKLVALVGVAGSGKSTVVHLIPRFYDPTGGRIRIDGHDVRQLTLSSLRRNIGVVPQEPSLFADSIRDNIAFGTPEAEDLQIEEAAKAAQAHEFIERLPDGYSTRIGERGVTLSGGQKQRLAIARALLRDPRILILDDATSNVDTETEARIQAALEILMKGRTSFVIAHRLSTILKADRILVMEEGRIVAEGTHRELLRTSGLYVEIYEQQFRPQGEPAFQPVQPGGEAP